MGFDWGLAAVMNATWVNSRQKSRMGVDEADEHEQGAGTKA